MTTDLPGGFETNRFLSFNHEKLINAHENHKRIYKYLGVQDPQSQCLYVKVIHVLS